MSSTPVDYQENLKKLEDHILRVERSADHLDDLKGDSEPFRRYVSGLKMARDIMTGDQKVTLPA